MIRATIIFGMALCLADNSSARTPVGESFTIGAYYAMPTLEPSDNFSWDYGFMDMARVGSNYIVVGGNCGNQCWAAIKNWGMTGVTSYGELNGYPGEGAWSGATIEPGIIVTRDYNNGLTWNGEYVGDAIVGHIMTDEPECHGLTEDEKNFLRKFADLYHQQNPTREIIVNHCDPPWYDLNEKHATCSAAPTISVNAVRITERIQAAQDIGLDNFSTVALMGRISDWAAVHSGGSCTGINEWSMVPCTQETIDWLASRPNYQDAYEEMLTAYFFGTKGFHPYIYNQHRGYSPLDIDGNCQYGIRAGFSDAAHDLRRSHGWPGVELFNNGQPFTDCKVTPAAGGVGCDVYTAQTFILTATAVSDSGLIDKVIFGKSTDSGATWTSIEDAAAPYSANFATSAGETVIFRAQAVDTAGKKSIFSANRIYIN